MSALNSVRKNIITPDRLTVKRNLAGQVEITLADKTATVGRDQAVQITAAILDCAGVKVNFLKGAA
jgi:hypothetical protein